MSRIHFKSHFDKHDRDGSGHISMHEFSDLVYELGFYMDGQQLELAFKVLDTDQSGQISYAEFEEWIKTTSIFGGMKKFDAFETICEYPDWIEWLIETFKWYDVDKSGSISHREFKRLCDDYPFNAHAAWEEVDADGDGSVSFNEFMPWVWKNYDSFTGASVGEFSTVSVFSAESQTQTTGSSSGACSVGEMSTVRVVSAEPQTQAIGSGSGTSNVGEFSTVRVFSAESKTQANGSGSGTCSCPPSQASGSSPLLVEQSGATAVGRDSSMPATVFDVVDRDGDGRLSANDFAAILSGIGEVADADTMELLARGCHANGTATCSARGIKAEDLKVASFAECCTKAPPALGLDRNSYDQLLAANKLLIDDKEVFRQLASICGLPPDDLVEPGEKATSATPNAIDKTNFRAGLKTLGLDATDEEVNEMFRGFSVDSEGFRAMLKRGGC